MRCVSFHRMIFSSAVISGARETGASRLAENQDSSSGIRLSRPFIASMETSRCEMAETIAVPEKSRSLSARDSPAADQTQTWASNTAAMRFSIFGIPVFFRVQEIAEDDGGCLGPTEQFPRRTGGNRDQCRFLASWTVAGHPALLRVRRGSGEAPEPLWTTPPPPAGVRIDPPQAAFRTSRSPLTAGDVFLLFTDGVIEAETPAAETFGGERLAASFIKMNARNLLLR